MIDWYTDEQGHHWKHVGEIVMTVRQTDEGDWWWCVDLPEESGDDGDQDLATSLPQALQQCEEALDLIIDEIFNDMTLRLA